jgi:two-component system chemotaxis response regulator CheY
MNAAVPRRVLIADDNPHVRDIVEQAVSRLRTDHVTFTFVEATGGDEVLNALWDDAFDMAILDIYMPVVDGVRLVSRIREHPDTATLPVLVVSSGGADAGKTALAAGADLFLEKPLKLVDLQDAVRTLLKLPTA